MRTISTLSANTPVRKIISVLAIFALAAVLFMGGSQAAHATDRGGEPETPVFDPTEACLVIPQWELKKDQLPYEHIVPPVTHDEYRYKKVVHHPYTEYQYPKQVREIVKNSHQEHRYKKVTKLYTIEHKKVKAPAKANKWLGSIGAANLGGGWWQLPDSVVAAAGVNPFTVAQSGTVDLRFYGYPGSLTVQYQITGIETYDQPPAGSFVSIGHQTVYYTGGSSFSLKESDAIWVKDAPAGWTAFGPAKTVDDPDSYGPWTDAGYTDWSRSDTKPADTDTVKYGEVVTRSGNDQDTIEYSEWVREQLPAPWVQLPGAEGLRTVTETEGSTEGPTYYLPGEQPDGWTLVPNGEPKSVVVDTKWSHTKPGEGWTKTDKVKEVPGACALTAPKWTDECGPGNGEWTYKDSDWYSYTVKVNEDGSQTVTVTPDEGYAFAKDAVTSWTESDSGELCPAPEPTTRTVPHHVESCELGGSKDWDTNYVTTPIWNPEMNRYDMVEGEGVDTEVTFTLYDDDTYFEKCAPPQPKTRETFTDWEDAEWECGDTTVTQTRNRTTTDYTWNAEKREWQANEPVVFDEHRTRDLTEAEQEQDCAPVPPEKPQKPEEPPVIPNEPPTYGDWVDVKEKLDCDDTSVSQTRAVFTPIYVINSETGKVTEEGMETDFQHGSRPLTDAEKAQQAKDCAQSPSLAATGSDTTTPLWAGGALLFLAAGAVLATKRRKSQTDA